MRLIYFAGEDRGRVTNLPVETVGVEVSLATCKRRKIFTRSPTHIGEQTIVNPIRYTRFVAVSSW